MPTKNEFYRPVKQLLNVLLPLCGCNSYVNYDAYEMPENGCKPMQGCSNQILIYICIL